MAAFFANRPNLRAIDMTQEGGYLRHGRCQGIIIVPEVRRGARYRGNQSTDPVLFPQLRAFCDKCKTRSTRGIGLRLYQVMIARSRREVAQICHALSRETPHLVYSGDTILSPGGLTLDQHKLLQEALRSVGALGPRRPDLYLNAGTVIFRKHDWISDLDP